MSVTLRDDLWSDPAVAFIATRCGVTTCHAVGALGRAWSWARRLTVDGKVPLATLELLDQVATTPGLSKAMEEAGWLVVGKTYLLFPKWDRHNSDAAKARAMTAERVRRHRNGKALQAVTETRDHLVLHNEIASSSSDSSSSPTQKDPSEKKKRASKPEWSGAVPEKLSKDPRASAAWWKWLRFRRDDLRKPVTQLSGDQALELWAERGPERFVAAIEHTIAQGWQGLREPDPVRGQGAAEDFRREQTVQTALKELGL